jgi:hypothetical protein
MNILQFSAGPNGTRNLGIGGGPNLMARSVVTADDVHTDGLYWMRPWDLMQFGPAGEAVMAANGGKRYAWLWSSDHADPAYGWPGGTGIHLGFSNDIALPPKVGREIITYGFIITGQGPLYNGTWVQMETPWLLWKVEDETDPFRLYAHGGNISVGIGQYTIVYKSADLLTWTRIGISHDSQGHSGYQKVFRSGENDYWSHGLNGNNTGNAIWSSTDAEIFTEGTNISHSIGNIKVGAGTVGPSFLIGEQRYILITEDRRHPSINEKMLITAMPVSDTWANPADDSGFIRVSTEFEGTYPGPSYLQSVDYAVEDGIAHIFPKRGFFADVGIVAGASYENGGGLDDQIADYYRFIFDETAARQSAPAGVRASVNGGVVTLRWYDALPQRTYRVYRATENDLSDKVLVGDVTGTQVTDTPDVTGTRYYEVMTLNAGAEEKSRVVSPYVSIKSALVNEHVERALAAGAPIETIDLDHLAWAESALNEIGAKNDLAFWPMLEFGHLKNESNVLSKCFCLGSTLKPRGGDLTFATTNTTYNAAAWDGLPAWTASTGAAQSYFGGGNFNNIRRAGATGITLIAAYQKTNTFTASLLNYGEFSGYSLQNTSGNPGSCAISIARAVSTYDTDTHPTMLANSTSHIIGGTITSSRVTSYVEGAPGSGVNRTMNTFDAIDRDTGSNMLGSGSTRSKVAVAADTAVRTYSFHDGHAQFAGRMFLVFTRALSDSQMATLNARLREGP